MSPTKINDGGPAFPMQEPQAIYAKAAAAIAHIPGDQTEERDRAYMQARADAVGGMSLRDYFATHCDIGDVDQLSVHVGAGLLGRNPPLPHDDPLGCMQWWAEYRARLRYIEADAMLKARAGEAS